MSDKGVTTASAGVNLTNSLVSFVPASGSLISQSKDVYNWLVRERIDEAVFEKCKSMAVGLAYPNAMGEGLQHRISNADKRIMSRSIKTPFQLVVSDSVGRLLAHDPETCYLVTTVAALSAFYHSDRITETICAMILDKGGHEKHLSTRYNVQRAPIRAVLSKITESIYLNVINAGHSLDGLPEPLSSLCQHVLESHLFAGIVMGVQRSKHDVLIKCDQFLADLTLWLLAHFHGRLEVAVAQRIVFERQHGEDKRVIRIFVRRKCKLGKECEDPIDPIEASYSVGDQLKIFVSVKGGSWYEDHPDPSIHRPLYDIGTRRTGQKAEIRLLKDQEVLATQNLAKRLVEWLLDLQICADGSDERLIFWANVCNEEDSNASPDRTLATLLPRHPGIFSMNTGVQSRSAPIVLTIPDTEDSAHRAFLEAKDSEALAQDRLTEVVSCFPIITDLLGDIAARCRCSRCRNQDKVDSKSIFPGCLRGEAVNLLFDLVAHAICDSSGVHDVTGYYRGRETALVISKLLHDIIFQRYFDWQTWFEAVTYTAAGILLGKVDDNTNKETCFVVQNGSYLLLAPWLDISQQLSLRSCLGVICAEGSIRGIVDDIGLLFAENGGQQEFDDDRYSVSQEEGTLALDECYTTATARDTVQTAIYTSIFRTSQRQYNVMITVRAGDYVVNVNPVRCLTGLARSPSIRCGHDADQAPTGGTPVRVDDFDTASLLWPRDHDDLRVSKVLESYLKINTLMSSCHFGSARREITQSCLQCAVDACADAAQEDSLPKAIINFLVSRERYTRGWLNP